MKNEIIGIFNDILKKYNFFLKKSDYTYDLVFENSNGELVVSDSWESFDEMMFDNGENITIFDHFNGLAAEYIFIKGVTSNIYRPETLIPERLRNCDRLFQEISHWKSSCLEELMLKIQSTAGFDFFKKHT
jgi:hypothetical protein